MSGSAEEMIAYLEQGGQSLEQSVPKMSAAADDLGMAAGSYDMVQTVVDEARGFTRGVVSEAREAASALEPLAEVITELGGRLSAAGDSLMAAADAAKAAREHYGGAPGLTDDAAGKIEEAHGKAKESADGAYSAAGSFVQGVGEEHTPTPAAHQHSIMASDMADRTWVR